MTRSKNLQSYANKLEVQLMKKQDSIFQLIAEAMQKTNELKQVKLNLIEKENLVEKQYEELENLKSENKILENRLNRTSEKV